MKGYTGSNLGRPSAIARLISVPHAGTAVLGSLEFTVNGAPGDKSTRAWVRGDLRVMRDPPVIHLWPSGADLHGCARRRACVRAVLGSGLGAKEYVYVRNANASLDKAGVSLCSGAGCPPRRISGARGSETPACGVPALCGATC